MDPKLSVSTDKELLKLGNDIIELRDESSATYRTDDLSQFIRFCEPFSRKSDPEPVDKPLPSFALYYTASTVELYDERVFAAPRDYDPVAVCSMAVHPRLSCLMSANSKRMDIDDFEKTLRSLRANMGTAGLEILDNIRDLSIAKVQKVERKKERNGNYHYLVQRQSAGEGDYQPPEIVKFKVPIFLGVALERELEFDLTFDPKTTEDGVQLIFEIESLNISEAINDARRSVLAEVLAPMNLPSYWGSIKREIKTDEWSKKINGVHL